VVEKERSYLVNKTALTKMLPQVYLACFQSQLSATELLTLEILIWLLQAHKQVRIERLAALFPEPIKFESRHRRLQRFLILPKLSLPLLWFPLVKYILRSRCKKTDYWKRKYRGTGTSHEGWYILTNLESLTVAVDAYQARSGIVCEAWCEAA
jgi:hypothetical protein